MPPCRAACQGWEHLAAAVLGLCSGAVLCFALLCFALLPSWQPCGGLSFVSPPTAVAQRLQNKPWCQGGAFLTAHPCVQLTDAVIQEISTVVFCFGTFPVPE